MKEDNKDKKNYSSKNSKYLQQAQKLFDDKHEKNNKSVNNVKTSGKTNVNTVNKGISGNQSKKSVRSQNYKQVNTGAKKSNNQKTVKKTAVSSANTGVKKVSDKAVSVKKVPKKTPEKVLEKPVVETKKVQLNKSNIKENLPKIDPQKAQEEAKKKTLELVEDLKQQKSVKENKAKEKVEEEKKKQTVSKRPQVSKQIKTASSSVTNKNAVKNTGTDVTEKASTKSPVKPTVKKQTSKTVSTPKPEENKYKFDDIKNGVVNKKDTSSVLITNLEQPKTKKVEKNVEPVYEEDELLKKLQQELDKKNIDIIKDLNLNDEEQTKNVDVTGESHVVKKVDKELKSLIEQEEKQEKKEKTKFEETTIKTAGDGKKQKEKKPITKFGKVLSYIAYIGFIFYVVASVIFVVKLQKIELIPTKILYIGSAVLVVVAIIMILFNITRFKFLHFLELLLTIGIGIVLLYGCFYVDRVNKSLKALFDSEELKALYYVVVPADSKYNSIDDIKELKVALLQNHSDEIKDALKDYNLNYNTIYSISGLSDLLLSEKADEKVDAIIINQAAYDNFGEVDKKFKQLVKIIYEFEIVDTGEIAEESDEEIQQGETEKPQVPSAPKRDPNLLKDVNMGNSFIIMINGVDGRGDTRPYGLSDVNMLAVVNPNTHKVLLVSVPRDYYVRIPGTTPGMRDKLSHSGLYGINTTMAAMEGIFGIPIKDYVQFGFNAVPIVVDSVGGVDVYSDTEFDSYHMKGWHVPKGNIHLDGKQALAYARERYAYINMGDKHRVKNQQDVIQAIIKKVSTNPQQLLKFDQVLNAINPYMNTNISYDRMQSLVKQQLNTLTPWTVEKISVDGYDGYEVTASYPKDKAYVMYPYENTIIAAQQKIKAVILGN